MSASSRSLLTGLLAISTVMAQQPQVPPLPGNNPGGPGAGGAPAVRGVPNGPAANAANENVPLAERVSAEGWAEPKINGERLAELYTLLTGRRVTVSNAAIAAEFRFVQSGPINYAEAAELLKIAAVIEGFVFVPAGPNHDKLVVAGQGTNPKQMGLPVYTEADELPKSDEVVTYVMTLKYIKPDEIVRAFTSVVGQFGAFGSVAAVPNASSVIITENTSLIRTLIELQKSIDVPASDVGTKFIKVQYADVTELAETLNQLVGSQQQQPTSAGVQRVQTTPPVPNLPIPGGGQAAANNVDAGSAGEQIPVQIVPNARTNEVFVMGRPVDIIFVEGLVRGFDSPTDQKNFLNRKLRFLSVAEFLPVAEQALTRAFTSGTSGGGAASAAGGSRGGSGANFGGGGSGGSRTQATGSNRSSGFGSNNSSLGGNSSGGNSSGGFSSSGGLGDANVDTAPEALLVGRTLLVADKISNSIVVQGPPASLEIIGQLLDEIDVKPEQVVISCVFGQLTLRDEYELGVDYLHSLKVGDNKAFGGRGGSGAGGVIDLDGTTTFDPGSLAASSGLGLYGRIGRFFNIYLKALQETGDFKVLSRPTISMANNQKGLISSGTQIAVPTNSFNSGTTGQSTNVEFRDVALTLEVIPLVNSDTEVTLQISLVSQDLGDERIIGSGDNALTTNDIINRELLTTVTVPNNETIVLGGLITSRDTKSKTGIPLLSQIPYVGGLFGTTTTDKNRDELLIFIQPQIVKDRASLYAAQADLAGRYKVDDKGRDFINGPGVLPPDTSINQPVLETKGGSSAPTATPVTPEEQGGPRRATSRPKGFVKRR